MKLEKILSKLNSLEKNSFIKIIDTILIKSPSNSAEIEKLIADSDQTALKGMETDIIAKIFNLVESEFMQLIKSEFVNTSNQLDILIDILIRDGNCILKQDWFMRLYEKELDQLKNNVKSLEQDLESDKSSFLIDRKRDFSIYKKCLSTAYSNDEMNNREAKISQNELSIILTLASELNLSQEEVKLINYSILPIQKLDFSMVIQDLKNMGVLFHSKKSNDIYVSDEMVALLRKIREKEIADKHIRRVLSSMKETQLNLICKNYSLDRKLSFSEKIKRIIQEGISIRSILEIDIFKENTNLTDKKKFLNAFWEKNLGQTEPLRGSTITEKVTNILSFFNTLEKDEKINISLDGYEKLLIEISDSLPHINELVKNEFEIQEEDALKSKSLIDYNIKPRDILDVIEENHLKEFCEIKEISTRGNCIDNVLGRYKDSENLFLENYSLIAKRDLNNLKENGIYIKEAELGSKFESLTKSIFSQLGLDVDEKLRKQINTSKDKIDILINLGNDEVILVECKTSKENGYNKFSSVSRQMKSYLEQIKKSNYKIIKSLLIAPDFSDEFINDTELEYDLNLSLITAESLLKILTGFKNSPKHNQFPYKLLLRDVLIQENRIIKAMEK